MVTLKDVAKLAKTSPATVSLVLNGKNTVSVKTTEKVLAAVEELGYRPNMVARSFKTQQTKTIAILVPTIINPVYPAFVHAVEMEARREGYTIILCSYDDGTGPVQTDYLENFYDRLVDGIIICGIFNIPKEENTRKLEKIMESYINRRTPFVFFSEEEQLQHFIQRSNIDINAHAELFHLLTIDRDRATYEAVRHLIHSGHHTIAFISEGSRSLYPHNIPYTQKLAGYKRALDEASIPFDETLILAGSDDYRGGAQCFIELQQRENPPSAYICTGDVLALGVLHAAKDMGKAVPEEVSVIGFDNIPVASYWNPKLSTIAVPTETIGKEAFKRLFWLMNGMEIPPNKMTFDTELVIRESSR
jgi:DNA-binding LacI/PurR family transcriptional regulator